MGPCYYGAVVDLFSEGDTVKLVRRVASSDRSLALMLARARHSRPTNFTRATGLETGAAASAFLREAPAAANELALLSQKAAVSGVFEWIMEGNPTEARGGWDGSLRSERH